MINRIRNICIAKFLERHEIEKITKIDNNFLIFPETIKKMKKIKRVDKEEPVIFPEECDPFCPRRISRSKYILLYIVIIDVKY